MRAFTVILLLFFLSLPSFAQKDKHLTVFSGMAGYWLGTVEEKHSETSAVHYAALHARLAQDGSQLAIQLFERRDGALQESSQLLTYDTDSLLLTSTGVTGARSTLRRFHVQGLQKVRSPFQWVIRRVGTGAVASLRITDIMQNDSLIIVTEQSDNGIDWQTARILRLARHRQPAPVRFFLPGYERARRVSVIGDFNGWNPDLALLRRSRGGWVMLLELPPGEYQYAFSVDGVKVPDRLATTTINDKKGGQNAITLVR